LTTAPAGSGSPTAGRCRSWATRAASASRTSPALDEGAVRAVSVKTARTGFTESRRILNLCIARRCLTLQARGRVAELEALRFALPLTGLVT
jgi:hypothetical protein